MEFIVKQNISQVIVERILKSIGQGDYPPGSNFPSEAELMECYGVGRSSVREAMQALSIMGVVDIRPGQGTFVKSVATDLFFYPSVLAPLVDEVTTRDLLEVRSTIEPTMAVLAARRATLEDILEMDDLLNRCKKAIADHEPVYEMSAEFHLILAQASHNTVIYRLMQSIIGLMAARGASKEEGPGYVNWEFTSHWEIAEAIKNKNEDEIGKLMDEHIKMSAEWYIRFVKEANMKNDLS